MNIIKTLTIIVLILSLQCKAYAFEYLYSYNYKIKEEKNKKNNTQDNLYIYSNEQTKAKIKNIINYNEEKNVIYKNTMEEKLNPYGTISFFNRTDMKALNSLNFSNYNNGNMSVNFNKNISKKESISLYLEKTNLYNELNSNMTYSYNFSDKTKTSLIINTDEENNYNGSLELYQNLDWSSINGQYFFSNTDEGGNFNINWRQKPVSLGDSPILFSLTGGINKNTEFTDKKLSFQVSHKPVIFGENGMFICSLTGENIWNDNNTIKISGNINLTISDKLSINTSITDRKITLTDGEKSILTGTINLQTNISENFSSQIGYSFMNRENKIENDIFDSYNQNITASFQYNFSRGNNLNVSFNYNPLSSMITDIEGEINITPCDSQILRIRPAYDFEYKEFSVQLETFLIK